VKYNCRYGVTVEVFQTDTGTEFVTHTRSGEVISTVRASGPLADALLADLERDDA